MRKVIVVATSGWVFIGDMAEGDGDGSGAKLTGAGVIRRWGTTNGLGEIALCGPTKDTVIDPCGTVFLPMGAVIAVMECAK